MAHWYLVACCNASADILSRSPFEAYIVAGCNPVLRAQVLAAACTRDWRRHICLLGLWHGRCSSTVYAA